MKYLVLLYAEPGAWPPEEHRVALQESIDLCHTLHARGQYLGAAPLEPVSLAKCVRVRGASPIVSDGPYAETKEQLGGYFLIDVESMDEAIAIAAQIPGARRGTAEIRPVMEVTGLPAPR
ncbi:MAG: YciI family protein [Planctomycetia bacterium]|nr:YciI family protein [Planctomycetia bacterium]